MNLFFVKYTYYLLIFLFLSCNEENSNGFTLLESNRTNLTFRNLIKETEEFNIFKYQYFYNGGGTAIADFNNDGLDDIFFTGNMVKNRLFLNEGNLKFKDITTTSKVAIHEGWCSGANAVDINNDGWMDIYVCRTAFPFENLRKNLLLVNQKDGTFENEAAAYGLDDSAYATHSAFFDFDKDGDLDLLLLNHSIPDYSKGNLEIFKLKNQRNPDITNKLYENRDGKYFDISKRAGIEGNVLSFSLGLSISDFNNDHYQDIFVANDFNEPDYLFINQKDGTFLNEAEKWFDNMSMFSMGTDAADYDQNGYPDLMVLDMLPESNYLQKMHSGADNYEKVRSMKQNGFLDQYSRNTLHLNSGLNSFNEIGQMSGVSNTDWSWSTLFMDFDNDSRLDLFISNGYLRDHTDMDFLQYTADEVIKLNAGGQATTFEDYMESMPPIIQPNYFFSNSNSGFQNMNETWKLTKPSVSQGAAYSDLDNDGDLDLIINNSEDYSWLYRNNAEKNGNNWISFKLEGSKNNINGIGAKVTLYVAENKVSKFLQPSRGFQSSVSYKLHFGLGQETSIDSIKIFWPDGHSQIESKVEINKVNTIKYNTEYLGLSKLETDDFSQLEKVNLGIDYVHHESEFRDFNQQPLMPFYISDDSPKVYSFDLNGDNRKDVIISGDEDNTSKLFLRNNNAWEEKVISKLNGYEVSDMHFNGKYLYVSSGSYKYEKNSAKSFLQKYSFEKNELNQVKSFNTENCNTSCIALGDLNGDNIDEVFIGGQDWLNNFPLASDSKLISDKTGDVLFSENIGHVSDAEIYDINHDGTNELIVVGEWNKIKIFNYKNDNLIDVTENFIERNYSGYWLSLHLLDVNNDSKKDLLVTNLGNNNQLTASIDNPLEMYYADFDNNGSIDPFVGYYNIDGTYPLTAREDAIAQLPSLKRKYGSFESYANVKLKELIEDYKSDCPKLTIDTLSNLLFINRNGKLQSSELPYEMQSAPIYDIASVDMNDDGYLDLLCAGNKSKNKVKLGRLSSVLIDGFINDGKGNFIKKDNKLSFVEKGDVRSLALLNIDGKEIIIYCPISGELTGFAIK